MTTSLPSPLRQARWASSDAYLRAGRHDFAR